MVKFVLILVYFIKKIFNVFCYFNKKKKKLKNILLMNRMFVYVICIYENIM